MAHDILGFEWRIPRQGHVIVSLTGPGANPGTRVERAESYLWDRINELTSDPVRDYATYNPLSDQKALFRRFARLDGSNESIIKFANRYGRLGRPVESDCGGSVSIVETVAEMPDEALRDEDAPAEPCVAISGLEPLSRWQSEIRDAREFLDLWDAYSDRDDKKIGSLFETIYRRRGIEMGSADWLPQSSLATTSLHRFAEQMRHTAPAKVLSEGVRWYLWSVINNRLTALAAPEMVWESTSATFVLQIVPKCLLGAIWLQIAQMMAGKVNYHQCEGCGEWFEVHPEIARSDKRFCNNACRNKLYRRRKMSALELRDRGLTAEQVSHQLHSDLKTINRWFKSNSTG